MNKLRQHIAILLFGIFFFPLIFQPLHVVWHQAHAHGSMAHPCTHEHSEKETKTCFEEDVAEASICPICNYQFSINDLPEHNMSSITMPAFQFIYTDLITPQHCKQLCVSISPRAPPAQLS